MRFLAEGRRKLWSRFMEQCVVPARSMSQRQLIVATAVGLWGGIFPCPPCTMPSTMFSMLFYSVGVPAPQRFNVPMGSIAMVVNTCALPLNVLLMPYFMMIGREVYTRSSGAEVEFEFTPQLLQDLREQPVETVKKFGGCLSLGMLVWAAATPLVLGHIRVLGAVSTLKKTKTHKPRL